MTFLKQAAVLLGGHVSNDQILCPGPNHKPGDRSLSIKFDPNHSDGFVCYSYAGDDWEVCRAHIKSKIDHLLPFCDVQSDQANIVQIQTLTASSDEGLYEAASNVMGGRKPDHIYLYRDESGQGILQANVRWNDINGEKENRPFLFTNEGWKCRATPKQRPLYNLDQIISNPELDILIVEGEKAAEAASLFFSGVVSTWAGGASAVGKTDFSILAGRKISLWPDNDSAGQKAMRQVAGILKQLGAEVKIVDLETLAQFRPNGPQLSEGWDAADAAQEGWENGKLYEAMISSLKTVAPVALVAQSKPLPLYQELSPPRPFPTEALGEILAPVVRAIAQKCQVPETMAAQSVLAVASLATQSHANVQMPYGQDRPIGVYLVTVASSGDRKSTVDNEALRGVVKYEKVLRVKYDSELQDYYVKEAAYNAEKRRIELTRKAGYSRADRQRELKELGAKPEKPLHPLITVSDTTLEGLVKNWLELHAGVGLFSSEGGQFTGGHGMAEENRLRTSAHLSSLWDGSSVKRLRAGDGALSLHGRRLSFHMMLQPHVAAIFLSDAVLRDQGLLSRVVVAAPISLAGTRFHKPVEPEDEATIKAFEDTIFKILNIPLPLAEGKRNELDPRSIPLTEDAKQIFFRASDHIEGQMGKDGNLEGLKDVGAKTPENAARIACILTLIENIAAQAVNAETMERALKLADWYLGEAGRLHESGRTDPKLIVAQDLLDWILESGGRKISQRDILRKGPKKLRTKAALKPMLAILIDHQWLTPLTEGEFLVADRGVE